MGCIIVAGMRLDGSVRQYVHDPLGAWSDSRAAHAGQRESCAGWAQVQAGKMG